MSAPKVITFVFSTELFEEYKNKPIDTSKIKDGTLTHFVPTETIRATLDMTDRAESLSKHSDKLNVAIRPTTVKNASMDHSHNQLTLNTELLKRLDSRQLYGIICHEAGHENQSHHAIKSNKTFYIEDQADDIGCKISKDYSGFASYFMQSIEIAGDYPSETGKHPSNLDRIKNALVNLAEDMDISPEEKQKQLEEFIDIQTRLEENIDIYKDEKGSIFEGRGKQNLDLKSIYKEKLEKAEKIHEQFNGANPFESTLPPGFTPNAKPEKQNNTSHNHRH